NQQTSNNKTAIYGPSDPGEVNVENFLSTQHSVDVVNDILFMDDEISTTRNEDVYVYEGESNIATYSSDTYSYSYTNLDETLSSGRNPHQTIQQSFDFLNSHTALAKEHMLFDYEEESNESIYRFTMNGYVVFSDEMQNIISVKYGNNAVYDYDVPQLKNHARMPVDQPKEPTTQQHVRYQIALNEELDHQKVSKNAFGYNMFFAESQTELSLLEFAPEWYVKYDGE